MEIVNIKINKLRPYEKNAKTHPKENIEAIKKSIEKYGFADPIGVWGKQNIIVEGHGRYLACKELGIDEVPCIRLDHLTDEERREYTLMHNKTTMMSDFDFDLLGEELAELDLSDFDLDWDVDIDENYGTEFTLPSGDKSDFEQITFTLHKSQAELIRGGLDLVENYEETYGNSNKNGNALYTIIKQWIDNRG